MTKGFEMDVTIVRFKQRLMFIPIHWSALIIISGLNGGSSNRPISYIHVAFVRPST